MIQSNLSVLVVQKVKAELNIWALENIPILNLVTLFAKKKHVRIYRRQQMRNLHFVWVYSFPFNFTFNGRLTVTVVQG